jgi:leucyl aminopeptidase
VTTYTLSKGAAEKTKADAVAIGVVRTSKGLRAAPGGEGVVAAYGRKFAPLVSTLGFTGKAGEVAKVPTGGTIKSPLLVLVGLGPAEAVDAAAVRRAAGLAIRAVSNTATLAVALPATDADQVRAVAEGCLLGGYTFTTYKSAPSSARPGQVVILTDAARSKATQQALEVAEVVGGATALARDWVNTPAGDMTPAVFAETVVAEHKARKPAKTTVSVVEDAELRKRGFGGVLGVGQGSANPPRLVQLRYRPKGATAHLALVGKGITYDSGGLTIKTSKGMQTMKTDMAGAAAVVAATFAIARLGIPLQVTTTVPMAENMPSGTATRPGDVLTMYDGQTVEVLNTDAEGRLVLADALALSGELHPDLIVDVATLTGASETALGDRVGAVLGNDDALVAQTVAAGARAGEVLWPLPIAEEMPEKVRTYSRVADLMQHNVDLHGGALYAAAFLQQFVGDTRWAHLDIAGPSFNKRASYGHVPSGATGFAVPTLVELAATLAAEAS